MKKPLVVFGTGEIGEIAHYYFSKDSDREVAAFAADIIGLAREILVQLVEQPVDQDHGPVDLVLEHGELAVVFTGSGSRNTMRRKPKGIRLPAIFHRGRSAGTTHSLGITVLFSKTRQFSRSAESVTT